MRDNPFPQIVAHRHTYAEQWKARHGDKVVGYLCTYVPEEIIYAAGMLPVRIFGSHQPQDITERHIFGVWCPFSRDCLAEGLRGRYQYLDGISIARTCEHTLQTFMSWQIHLPLPFSYRLYMPGNTQSPHALACLRGELHDFKQAIEQWTGRVITVADLDEAIQVYNTSRGLLRELYELRKRPCPPISGSEAMEIVLASMVMDKQEHNRLLEPVLKELKEEDGITEPGVRVMILGSETDDLELIRFIESLGTTVVIDDHCTGSRYFWNQVPPGPDRLSAIAARYLERPACPVKDLLERRRFPHLLELARQYRVQAAIFIMEKFCDPHQYDAQPIQKLFQEYHIPSLQLEVDVTTPVGQLRTRLEAFLEMLQMELV